MEYKEPLYLEIWQSISSQINGIKFVDTVG